MDVVLIAVDEKKSIKHCLKTTMPEIVTHEIETFTQGLIEDRKAALSTNLEWGPRDRPILSDIPDCERQIAYGVTNWKDRPKMTPELKARLNAGKVIEQNVLQELIGLGYEITRGQERVEVHGRDLKTEEKILLARGKVDGFISKNGKRFPFEIKSMEGNTFRQIETLDDFRKNPWARKYIRQLLMYLYGVNQEAGIFIIVNGLGAWKIIPVYLDFGEGEAILQMLERVHAHMKAGTQPDRIPYNAKICGRCDFKPICLPDMTNIGLELLDIPQMAEDLDRLSVLEPYAKEYDFLSKYNKDKARAYRKNFIVGNFAVDVTIRESTKYEIPDDVKEKYAKPGETIYVDFNPLQEKEATDGQMPEVKDISSVKEAHGIKSKKKTK